MSQTQNTQSSIPTPVMNAELLDMIERGDVTKVAQTTEAFVRTQIREDSYAFKIMPPQKLTDDMLDRDLDERLRVIVDIEPDSPGGTWVPFQTAPEAQYFHGPRGQISIARVQTRNMKKDKDELRTYTYDIKKVLSDNMIKDALATIDSKWTDTMLSICKDTAGKLPNLPQAFTGKVQWREFSGGLTKENFIEAKKMLPRGSQTMRGKFRLRNYIALMNDVTAQDWQKMSVPEIGYAPVEKMYAQGVTEDTYYGMKNVFTIKDDLIADNRVLFFAAPEFLGRAFYMTDWTTYMKTEAYWLEWYSYWLGGFGVLNLAGVALADFEHIA